MSDVATEETAALRPATGDVYSRAWMASNPAPTVIVADDLEILWENPAASALLNDGRHFARISGRMTCAEKGQVAGFQKFVASLRGGGEVWACRSADGSHLLVKANLVNPPQAAPAAVLTLHATGLSRSEAWADLGEIFGLTPAEAAIAKRLVGGDRAEFLARDMGVSPETVRTHIRRIYSKLAIGSREELFSTISPFRIAIA